MKAYAVNTTTEMSEYAVSTSHDMMQYAVSTTSYYATEAWDYVSRKDSP
jgi:hypothetical protein